HVMGYEIVQFPIPTPIANNTKLLETSYFVMNYVQADKKASKIILEQAINAIVLNLYFPDHMKERGIDGLEFVERDIEEVMQGRKFEKLSDADKEQVIEQLHAKWSHPDNEVVKRMAMFKEKSPEILKPILES